MKPGAVVFLLQAQLAACLDDPSDNCRLLALQAVAAQSDHASTLEVVLPALAARFGIDAIAADASVCANVDACEDMRLAAVRLLQKCICSSAKDPLQAEHWHTIVDTLCKAMTDPWPDIRKVWCSEQNQ